MVCVCISILKILKNSYKNWLSVESEEKKESFIVLYNFFFQTTVGFKVTGGMGFSGIFDI